MRAAIALLLLLLLSTLGWAQSSQPDTGALFEATLSDVHEQPFALAALRGEPLIVNFWARWCAPCRQEIPEFVKAQRAHPEIRIVGIGLEDNAEAVREFIQAYEVNYRILLARDQGLALLNALGDAKAGLPYTLVIDRRGRVLQRKLGTMQASDIDAAIRHLRID